MKKIKKKRFSLLTEITKSWCCDWLSLAAEEKSHTKISLSYLPHNDYLLLIGLLSWLVDKILSLPLSPVLFDDTHTQRCVSCARQNICLLQASNRQAATNPPRTNLSSYPFPHWATIHNNREIGKCIPRLRGCSRGVHDDLLFLSSRYCYSDAALRIFKKREEKAWND